MEVETQVTANVAGVADPFPAQKRGPGQAPVTLTWMPGTRIRGGRTARRPARTTPSTGLARVAGRGGQACRGLTGDRRTSTTAHAVRSRRPGSRSREIGATGPPLGALQTRTHACVECVRASAG
jgi:hypothetical protein